MNSTEAIISPNSEELLEFLMLEPHSQQVPSSQTVTEGIFVVYLEGIFMLNSIFQYFATSSKAFISLTVELKKNNLSIFWETSELDKVFLGYLVVW